MKGRVRGMEELLEKVNKLPEEPGVYLFKDDAGQVLYVGKAVSLRHRVRSYFQGSQSPKVLALLEKARDLAYIVTANEVEALVLEANLIKQHRPRYNVVLKDDKTYPY
ncbi:GIY-YIG nuclease family protein, partial [Thermodesulfitimonas autotrophica]|uniref:GIY-YIG nuclease family protein n=1 Tax=Thermodesulfitimonas autotrophica TaxID=1894989 RepID=UPI002FDF3625